MQSLQEAALLTGAADLVLQQYALSAPDMGAARFDFSAGLFPAAPYVRKISVIMPPSWPWHDAPC